MLQKYYDSLNSRYSIEDLTLVGVVLGGPKDLNYWFLTIIRVIAVEIKSFHRF